MGKLSVKTKFNFRRMIMKKTLIVVALALVMALAMVPATLQAADKIKVGFSNRTLNGPFFQALTTHIEQQGEAAGFEIIATDGRADYTKQQSDCEDLLSQGIKYLILNPQDPDAGIRIARQADSQGVKVITIDSDISLDAPVVTRILPDNAGNNIAIGRYAAQALGDKPVKIALISGNQGNLVGQERSMNFFMGLTLGQIELRNSTNFQIVTQLWGAWDQQGGLKAMEDALSAHPDLNAAYTENDDMAFGAIRAMESAGKTIKDIQIYSYDGNKNAYKAIIDGKMMSTGENNPEKMAKAAIETIQKLEKGETRFTDRTLMPVLMVNPDNAKEVYNPDSLF